MEQPLALLDFRPLPVRVRLPKHANRDSPAARSLALEGPVARRAP
jgi:hypothetical protein